MPKVKCITVLLTLLISMAALSVSTIGADDDLTWWNHGESQAFASGKDLGVVFSSINETLNTNTMLKISDAKFYAEESEFASFSSLTTLTLSDDSGATTTYSNGWSQSISSPEGLTVAMEKYYVLDSTTGAEDIRSSMKLVNSGDGETILDINDIDPNDPTDVVSKFVDGMNLGVTYDEIKGIEAHIGVQSGKAVMSDGFESGYLIKKNTEVRVD